MARELTKDRYDIGDAVKIRRVFSSSLSSYLSKTPCINFNKLEGRIAGIIGEVTQIFPKTNTYFITNIDYDVTLVHHDELVLMEGVKVKTKPANAVVVWLES